MKGIIYKLYNDTQCYIGSTVDIIKRLYHHKPTIGNNCVSNKMIKYDYEIIEEFEFNYLTTLRLKELWYILNTDCINVQLPFIYRGMGKKNLTKKEFQHIYYEKNKERIKKRVSEYQKKNLKKTSKDRNARTKVLCECGSLYVKRNKKSHQKTKRHQSYALYCD